VQDVLKPLVEKHLPFQAPGITTEGIYQSVVASSAQATEWPNPDTLRVHIRTILKHMHTSGEALREPAKGDNGGQTFVYMRSPNLQTANSHSGYTPSARSSPTTATRAHQDTAQYASGSPVNIRHLLWRPEEETALVTRHVAGARESSGNDDNAQAISQLNASSQSLAEPEPTIRAIDTPGSGLPRDQEQSGIGGEDPNKADMELLKTARRLRAEIETATDELSTLESQLQQAQIKCLTLERQAGEQRSKEVELLADVQRLREEIMKAESEAADCQKGADKLEKAADHERKSCKERETSIAATRERATEVEKRLQTIRDELKI
jgi:hypothetical protein